MGSLIKKIILHVILPLVAGFLIYILTRPLPLLNILNNGPAVDNFAIENIKYAHWFTRIIILTGPDFLWSYSFASALFIWKSYSGKISFSFLILVAGIMAFSELIQLAFLQWFTFDIADLLAAILATGLSYFLNARNA
jgi:hypothetical protein